MPGLQTGQPLSTTPQPVSDDTGVVSALSLSTTSLGIGTPLPQAALHVAGALRLEHNGSPKITLFSHGHGTQGYSIRATNAADPAGVKAAEGPQLGPACTQRVASADRVA
jgi:hypothetical protein